MASDLSISNLFTVKGLVVVITGGGSGLGSYAARALAANGAKAVYIIGRREDSLKQIAANDSDIIKPLVGDVTDKDSLISLASKIRQAEGYINVLFANAGIIGPTVQDLLDKSFGNTENPTLEEFQEAMLKPSMDDFTSTFHVNCTAVFYTTMAFLDLLDKGNKRAAVPQSSQVLVTSSIAGFSRKVAAGFAYNGSKAAVTHLTKALATYCAPYKIRFNVIAPGMYPSEMTERQIGKNKDLGHAQKAFEGAKVVPNQMCPAERTGSEQDFASTVLFMMSPAGAYLDGNALVTDGGRLGQLPSVY